MKLTDLILVINSGSASIKYSVMEIATLELVLAGVIETPHAAQSVYRQQDCCDANDAKPVEATVTLGSIEASCQWIYQQLSDKGFAAQLSIIAHRVVHGGDKYQQVTAVDAKVLADLQVVSKLAPLHNVDNIIAIECFTQLTPTLTQQAVFDTAFHQTLPPVAYRYAIPEHWYRDYQIRRYGFHGISHQYVATEAAGLLKKPLEKLNLISLHLGSGASACAIRHGKSIDTSMGFTPLEGLVMGSRSGDLDAEIPLYLQQVSGMQADEVQDQLNHASGLKALAGTQDMRELLRLEKSGDESAALAIDLFVYRIRKYIGAYFAVLGEVDALIFTGGIGENTAEIRARCCEGLQVLGLAIDVEKSDGACQRACYLSGAGQTPAVLLVPTNEALQIARECRTYLESAR